MDTPTEIPSLHCLCLRTKYSDYGFEQRRDFMPVWQLCGQLILLLATLIVIGWTVADTIL